MRYKGDIVDNDSNHSEPLGILDGSHEFLSQFLLGTVLRQQQVVEAGVGTRQAVSVGSVSAHEERQRTKTAYWSPVAASGELQELLPLPVSHVVVDDVPKPLCNLRLFCVPIYIASCSLQVREINDFGPANEQLQLFWVDQLYHIFTQRPVKASFKCFELLLALCVEDKVDQQLNIHVLVFLVNKDFSTLWQQLMYL